MKKKRLPKSFRNVGRINSLGLQVVGSEAIVGSLPANAAQTKVLSGLSTFSGQFPSYYGMAGASITSEIAGKTLKSTSKLFPKRKKMKHQF